MQALSPGVQRWTRIRAGDFSIPRTIWTSEQAWFWPRNQGILVQISSPNANASLPLIVVDPCPAAHAVRANVCIVLPWQDWDPICREAKSLTSPHCVRKLRSDAWAGSSHGVRQYR